MRRAASIALICAVVVILAVGSNSTRSPSQTELRFEIIEGIGIDVDRGDVYVLKVSQAVPPLTYIEKVNGWNLTINESLFVSNVLKIFDGDVYAAGADIVKIEDGRIEWIKDLAVKRTSYEGTKENPIPVYYEDLLNVFDIESDGMYLYLNTGSGIVKTDEDLNVVWAVTISGQISDDISVSDGIYATRWNRIIKLNKDGELEWAAMLVSPEMVEQRITKKDIKKGEIVQVERSRRVPKYGIEIYTIHAGNHVYVAGLARERLSDREEIYPFLAKLSTDGCVVWAEIVNVTYPGCDEHGCFFHPSSSKILKLDERTFIAWISEKTLLVFDENGKILDCYELKGYISDVDLIGNTILLASPEKANVEKRNALPIQINIKAVKMPLEGKRIKCYSKNWEKRETPIYIS